MRTVPSHQDGGLMVLQEVLHAEGGGPDLGLDVLEERAPSGVVDLLVEHDLHRLGLPLEQLACRCSKGPAAVK